MITKTEFVNEERELDESKLPVIPAGGTVLGGGAVPKGMQYVGTMTLCK